MRYCDSLGVIVSGGHGGGGSRAKVFRQWSDLMGTLILQPLLPCLLPLAYFLFIGGRGGGERCQGLPKPELDSLGFSASGVW